MKKYKKKVFMSINIYFLEADPLSGGGEEISTNFAFILPIKDVKILNNQNLLIH